MTMLILISFILFIAGSFILFEIKPGEFAQALAIPFQKKSHSIRKKVTEVTNPKKIKGIKKLVFESKEVLRATNKEEMFTLVSVISVSLFILGIFLSITMSNLFLLPVLSVGMAILPFAYVMFLSNKWKKELNAELETALSIITTSYLRSEDILSAFEENINYINPPVADVFKGFLAQTKLINSNIKLAFENLKTKIDHEVFHEWCDALIACQDDKNMKVTLVPIVSKLSDMRVVSAELEYMLYEPMKEFITMAILLIGNIPLMYFLNRNWYNSLMYTEIGKLVLAICASVLFISMVAVIRLSKSIEYKR
jgi:Flp pilus assembly protein TadB